MSHHHNDKYEEREYEHREDYGHQQPMHREEYGHQQPMHREGYGHESVGHQGYGHQQQFGRDYNQREYEERLMRVFARHPNIDYNHMMRNERMRFEPHEIKQMEREIEMGRMPHEQITRGIAMRGPEHVRELHEMARMAEGPGYREFAEDLAREFNY